MDLVDKCVDDNLNELLDIYFMQSIFIKDDIWGLRSGNAPAVELKTMPKHLKYVFKVIHHLYWSGRIKGNVNGVLKLDRKAFGWTIENIKGISQSLCMHKILIEIVTYQKLMYKRG